MPRNNLNDRTMPWHKDELITCNGVGMVYSVDDEGTVCVHMPGAEHRGDPRKHRLKVLIKRRDVRIAEPLKFRKEKLVFRKRRLAK